MESQNSGSGLGSNDGNNNGDGKKLLEEIYAERNIHPMLCSIIGPEGAGWFAKPIEKLDDFDGLRIRFAGIGGKVWHGHQQKQSTQAASHRERKQANGSGTHHLQGGGSLNGHAARLIEAKTLAGEQKKTR